MIGCYLNVHFQGQRVNQFIHRTASDSKLLLGICSFGASKFCQDINKVFKWKRESKQVTYTSYGHISVGKICFNYEQSYCIPLYVNHRGTTL